MGVAEVEVEVEGEGVGEGEEDGEGEAEEDVVMRALAVSEKDMDSVGDALAE